MTRILTGGGKDAAGNPTTAVVGRPGFLKNTRTFFQSVRRVAKTDPADGILNANISDIPLTDMVFASRTTALTGTNNDLKFTAVRAGKGGNNIRIRYVDPGGTTAAFSLVVSGNDITVNLARATSAITTTAAEIMAALNASEAVSALMTTALAPANDGTGIVTALSYTNLTGGAEGTQREAHPSELSPSVPAPAESGRFGPTDFTQKVRNRSSNRRITRR